MEISIQYNKFLPIDSKGRVLNEKDWPSEIPKEVATYKYTLPGFSQIKDSFNQTDPFVMSRIKDSVFPPQKEYQDPLMSSRRKMPLD